MDWLTRQHIGIIIVVVGTYVLARSVKVKRQYCDDAARDVDRVKKQQPEVVELTETHISRPLFWWGLALVAIGSALQW